MKLNFFLIFYFALGAIGAFMWWNKKRVILILIILFISFGFMPDLLEKRDIGSVEKINIAKLKNKLKKTSFYFHKICL
jgi:hypothetical protein